MKSVIGPWYVVAIIPEKLYPDKPVTCYRVEFSETDEVRIVFFVIFNHNSALLSSFECLHILLLLLCNLDCCRLFEIR